MVPRRSETSRKRSRWTQTEIWQIRAVNLVEETMVVNFDVSGTLDEIAWNVVRGIRDVVFA